MVENETMRLFGVKLTVFAMGFTHFWLNDDCRISDSSDPIIGAYGLLSIDFLKAFFHLEKLQVISILSQ